MWVEGHDDHEIEERETEFYCVTCKVRIPKKTSGGKTTVSPDVDLHDDDISLGAAIKIEF